MLERESKRQEKCFKLGDSEFRRIIGIKKETFLEMLDVLNEGAKRKKPGARPELKRADMLFLTLEYWREYRSFASLGVSYEVSESTAWRVVQKVENELIGSRKFSLPGKKALLQPENHFEVVVVDATESRIERPKTPVKNGKKIKNRRNKQKKYYSGKKKQHTIKSQIVVEKKERNNLCS
jgi:Helix-turn-helix of DDE superfamily endonuclease